MRMRTSERRICYGVKLLRPVSAFFKPRMRSQRACSIAKPGPQLGIIVDDQNPHPKSP
jgi:hypothetical protein